MKSTEIRNLRLPLDARAFAPRCHHTARGVAMSLTAEQIMRIQTDQDRVNAEAIANGARENPIRAHARTSQALARIDASRAYGGEPGQAWPQATQLPEGLPPVAGFDYELLPQVLQQYVGDVAERMQCPPDFPAVALLTVLSSVIGRRCGIMPKKLDDWTVVPNLWGMVIGRPGVMKSPPLQEVMRPLQILQTRAVETYESEVAEHQAGSLLATEGERVAKEAIRKLLKMGKRAEASVRAQDAVRLDPHEPTCKRYVVNDATVEKLGEILQQNPFGLLHFRDELTGFFRALDRQGHEADRAFYLECWNGDGSHTYDRIGRGTLHIQAACLSILGGIQPGPLTDLVRGLRGSGDDGLLQRFQLAVWPDASQSWRNVDRLPDRDARDRILNLIQRFDGMTAERLCTDPDRIPVLRFSDDAQSLFDAWRATLEVRLRNDSEHPTIEAHLAKYRSLIPSLALLTHLADSADGPVELIALERAIAWGEYLETHARRIYAPAISPDVDAARLLVAKIKTGKVDERFALRDIYRQGWSGLSTLESVTAAVRVLEDFGWLRTEQEQTPGRPRAIYIVNPTCLPAERVA
jgi:hypothetical protein